MTDAARLRELQRRAFAPNGGLTDAEAAELRALTSPPAVLRGTDLSAPAESDLAGSAASDAVVQPATREHAPAPEHASAPEPTPEHTPTGEPELTPPASHRRSRFSVGILAAIVTLLIGFGAGWLVFGRDAGVQMTAAQSTTWTELESSEEFDAGSIEFTGAQGDVSVWYATRDDGELACIIMTAPEQSQHACRPAAEDDLIWNMQVSLMLDEAEDEEQVGYFAMLIEDVHGNWVPIIQEQSGQATFDWHDMYEGRELEIAEMLDSSGFDGEMLQVIGYDGDTPVWLHTASDQPCVLVADERSVRVKACGEFSVDQSLQVQSDGVAYVVTQTEMRGPVLTIIRTGEPIDEATGEVIDDKSGEVGE